MAKVNDFASELTERYGLSAEDADGFIAMMFDVISEELDSPDKQVKVKGLGTFKVTSVGARASVDVNTGERIVLEGRNKISFTPDVALRDRVNRPFAQFETVVLNDGVDFSEIDREFGESQTEKDKGDVSGDSGDAADDTVEDTDLEEVEKEYPDSEEADGEKTAEEANQNLAEAVDLSDADAVGLETKAELECAVAESAGTVTPVEDAADDATERSDEKMEAVSTGEHVEEQAGNDVNEYEGEAETAADDGMPKEAVGRTETADSRDMTEDTVRESAGQTPQLSDEESVGEANGVAENGQVVCKQRNPRVMYWLTAASFVLLVCIGVGMYMLYRQVEAKNEAIELLQKRLADNAEKGSTVAVDTAAAVRRHEKEKLEEDKKALLAENTAEKTADNAKLKAASAADNAKEGRPVKSVTSEKNTASSEKNTAPKDAKTAATAAPNYSSDVRIRTGAYVIVGTDRIVTVRSGQTLASISKANLGPGMECYVEAYNNVKTVKAGDKLKIPKLKLKKLH